MCDEPHSIKLKVLNSGMQGNDRSWLVDTNSFPLIWSTYCLLLGGCYYETSQPLHHIEVSCLQGLCNISYTYMCYRYHPNLMSVTIPTKLNHLVLCRITLSSASLFFLSNTYIFIFPISYISMCSHFEFEETYAY